MKKLTTLALIAIAASGHAQIKEVWHNNFIDPALATRTLQTAVTPNGNSLVLSITENYSLRLNRYDGAGTLKWTQTYAVGADLSYPIFMRTDLDGAAIFAYRNTA